MEAVDDFSAYRAQRLDIEAAVIALANITSELEKHEQFREDYNEKKEQLCDLQDTDLRGLRFVRANLSKFDFGCSDMSGAWLAHANFSGARFCRFYDMQGTTDGTKFTFAKLEGANFGEALLFFANFQGVEIRDVNFKDARLHGANFTEAQVIKTDLRNASLNKSDFTDAFLSEVKIGDASLKEVNFTKASLLNMYNLRQWQLDEAFCWEGHNTFVTSAEEYLLEPPPQKNVPTDLWVYKNVSALHSRIMSLNALFTTTARERMKMENLKAILMIGFISIVIKKA